MSNLLNILSLGTLAGVASTALLVNTPILSLTTASTAACTADFYIWGVDLS